MLKRSDNFGKKIFFNLHETDKNEFCNIFVARRLDS